MRIGELAHAAGVSTRAVRHYEQAGLITSTRAHNGYRVFDARALRRVRNISFLVAAGLTLDDVGHFLECLDGDVSAAPPAPAKLAVARARLRVLEERIAAQTRVRDRLAEVLREAEAASRPRHSR
ncbi:MerR family transcriptional regulator [Nocardiopsis gilva YIM 90087]|uniref:MerR family transcriptional regulator n=1 Tax=Nocardiopsis gilva YIM 90087 TaxID=1235441 RepID=A0A223S7P5_9ACTN|nr:MerR family transcriptional regulator [Nocardiopsis gilva]ASU84133.1 MerR family transcriptional regulator [Nocardiopsis gilva YIM 90087]